jgi:hypothetical protein
VMAGPTPASPAFPISLTPPEASLGKRRRRTILSSKDWSTYCPGRRHGEPLPGQLRESLCGGRFDLYFRGCALVLRKKGFWQRFEDEGVSMFSFSYFLLSAWWDIERRTVLRRRELSPDLITHGVGCPSHLISRVG